MCSTGTASTARLPPPVPAAVQRPSLRVEGFSAPESSGVALSPGKLQTKSSLLTASLLEPAGTLSPELYGAALPSHNFQGLVVLPDVVGADLPPVDMASLLELQAHFSVFRSSNVTAAYTLAARAHAGQVRKNGEPVLAHLLATARILAELGLPEEVVAAGLLHDVLCDTTTTAAQLSAVLPSSVVGLVSRVSQLNQLSQSYRDNTHSLEAEAMLDMLTGMDDVSALLIKLADRLHNMRTVGALSRCKQVRMASETLDVFAVLANRLGAWAIKAELEDLSFKTLNPEEYELVARAIAARTAAAASSNSGGGLAAGIDHLTAALRDAGLEVVDVSGRVKNTYGVWKKIQKHLKGSASGSRVRCIVTDDGNSSSDEQLHDQDTSPAAAAAGGVAGSPSQSLSPAAAAVAAGSSYGSSEERAAAVAAAVAHVYDIQALRVVVPHKHDCYAALRVVQELWTAMPGRLKDYIRQRKANGYQSLHLTVRDEHGQPLEVQIRTPKMHYIAEYGFAAHWRYKERLGRQDLWLDRLVQWKKWVASEKLGIVDRKLRPSGSPGSGGDAALADLAKRLQLERAASAGGSTGATIEAALTAVAVATAAADSGKGSSGDAVAAELAAVVRARKLQQHAQQQWQEPPQLVAVAAAAASSRSSRGMAVPAAAAALSKASALSASLAAATGAASSPADEKFAARFRMRPISRDEEEQHGASVMVTGPRGVSITQLPARCTVGQLLASKELTSQLRRAGSSSLGPAFAAGTAHDVDSASCRLAVNGVVVLPGQADQVVLRSGDQVQLLEDPPLLPLLGLGPSSGPTDGVEVGTAQLLPGVMAEAGGSLNLFVPGQGEPLERALQQKLGVRTPLHASALVA